MEVGRPIPLPFPIAHKAVIGYFVAWEVFRTQFGGLFGSLVFQQIALSLFLDYKLD